MSFFFNLSRLPRVEFGSGRIARIPDLVAHYGSNILIVTGGNSFLAGPHWPALSAALAAREISHQLVQVRGEPSPDFVDAAVRTHTQSDIDCVLGIGGGSVLDAAKAIAGLLRTGNSVMDHLEG